MVPHATTRSAISAHKSTAPSSASIISGPTDSRPATISPTTPKASSPHCPVIHFARIFGANAIAAFILSSIITSRLDAIHLHIGSTAVSLHHVGYQYLFAPWLPPRTGSLAYALVIVAFNAAILYPLYRKRIFLRIESRHSAKQFWSQMCL